MPKKVKSLNEIVAAVEYLNRIGADIKGMLRAEVASVNTNGYERPVTSIVFSKDGAITIKSKRNEFAPTEAETASIKEAFKDVVFLRTSTCASIPDHLKNLDRNHRFVFYDRNGKSIICIVQRIDPENPLARKVYLTHTMLEDGSWALIEPDGGLPVYGLELLKSAGLRRVMLHEGPKAAQGARDAAQNHDHPFHETLKHFTHVGWHGGAHRPFATDWRELEGVDELIIVPDNDDDGRKAIPRISKYLPKTITAYAIDWPLYAKPGGDFADEVKQEFIDKNWQPLDGVYSATWATDEFIPPGEKKVAHKVRDTFARQWAYTTENDLFVSIKFPLFKMTAEQFDNHHRKFSHVKKLADLMKNNNNVSTYFNTTYLPGFESGAAVERAMMRSLNVYTPTQVKPKAGDVKPWLDFLEHLIINEDERQHTTDYIATLIAKPQNRPGYGLLLISKTQGVGKGTLIEFIEKLVGKHNVSCPNADEIVTSQFNDWIAYKTLVYCGEIYEGHSWKAGNRLKSLITDPVVRVNTKHMRQESLPNFAWFIVCSNDTQPIKLEDSDRRWYVPKVTEELWDGDKWRELRNWFNKNGASAILYWARNYKRAYLAAGDKVPMTENKQTIISQSEDEEIQHALDLLEHIASEREKRGKPRFFAFEMSQLRSIAQSNVDLKDRLSSKVFTQRINRKGKVFTLDGTIRVNGMVTRLFTFEALPENNETAKSNFENLNDYNMSPI